MSRRARQPGALNEIARFLKSAQFITDTRSSSGTNNHVINPVDPDKSALHVMYHGVMYLTGGNYCCVADVSPSLVSPTQVDIAWSINGNVAKAAHVVVAIYEFSRIKLKQQVAAGNSDAVITPVDRNKTFVFPRQAKNGVESAVKIENGSRYISPDGTLAKYYGNGMSAPAIDIIETY